MAEAGKGGPEGPTNCQVLRGLKRCFGLTGALTRVWRGKQERVAIRLPSVTDLTANPEVGGPNDVSFLGRGGTFLTIGLGGDPTTVRPGYGPAVSYSARLFRSHQVPRIATSAGTTTMGRSGSGASSPAARAPGASSPTFRLTKPTRIPPAVQSIAIHTDSSRRLALASSRTQVRMRSCASPPTARCQPWPCCHGPWADRPEQSTQCQRRSRWDQTARITSGC